MVTDGTYETGYLLCKNLSPYYAKGRVIVSSCLVIVDVQNGFLNRQTEPVIEKLGQLLRSHAKFDHIVATKFVNFEGSMYTKMLGWRGMMDKTEQHVHPLVETCAEHIFEKTSYTCFTVEFEEWLWSNDIKELYFVGIETDACVMKCAMDSFDARIPCKVLAHYCASCHGELYHNMAVSIMHNTLGDNVIEGEIDHV